MNEQYSESAWKALLDADYNARYWACMALQFVRREKLARLLVAFLSSATVASWFLWIQAEAVWKALSIIAAAASVMLPILDVSRKVELMRDLRATDTQFSTRFNTAKASEVELSKKSIGLPSDDPTLQEACYAEVLRSRGLNN